MMSMLRVVPQIFVRVYIYSLLSKILQSFSELLYLKYTACLNEMTYLIVTNRTDKTFHRES